MKVKIDFKKDIVNGEDIDMKKWRAKLSLVLIRQNNNYYNSEISNYYHKSVYGKSLVDLLPESITTPLCPITGDKPSYKLQGSIVFGKFSNNCTTTETAKYVAENNKEYKLHVERMKEERKGKGNPMYGIKAWNKGKTKDNNEVMKKLSERRKGVEFSNETLERMSESAKKREIHGHTGFKHSEETKQRLRDITIARYKSGVYSHGQSKPHLEVKRMLSERFGKDTYSESNHAKEFKGTWEEEFSCYGYSFDFRIGSILIEVQGDFFHSNQNTRHSGCTHDVQIKNKKRDIKKRHAVESDGSFQLIELWENDIINNESIIKNKIKCLNLL